MPTASPTTPVPTISRSTQPFPQLRNRPRANGLPRRSTQSPNHGPGVPAAMRRLNIRCVASKSFQ